MFAYFDFELLSIKNYFSRHINEFSENSIELNAARNFPPQEIFKLY